MSCVVAQWPLRAGLQSRSGSVPAQHVQQEVAGVGVELQRLKALAMAKQLAEADPRNVEVQRDLSIAYGNLADVQMESGDAASAQPRARRQGELPPSSSAPHGRRAAIHNAITQAVSAHRGTISTG